MKRLFMSVLVLLLVSLSACSARPTASTAPAPTASTGIIEVRDAWVRINPGEEASKENAVLYMVIVNHGSSADTLLKVKTDSAQAAKMHQTQVDASGVASMPEVSSIEIPAGGMVEFKTGGYHVMIVGLHEALKEGGLVKFKLFFQTAGTLVVKARVIAK